MSEALHLATDWLAAHGLAVAASLSICVVASVLGWQVWMGRNRCKGQCGVRPCPVLSTFSSSDSYVEAQKVDPDSLMVISLATLGTCNGTVNDKLYVSLLGLVHEVGKSEDGRAFYGPGGSYSLFAGQDATVSLAKMSMDAKLRNKLPSTWKSLTEEERRCINDWANRFRAKYTVVGKVDFGSEEENELAATWRKTGCGLRS